MNWFLYLSLAMVNFSVLVCRDGFIKDQNEDLVQFPPKVFHSFDSAIPVGHLRPLGWQREPDGIVKEVPRMLTSVEFFRKFVSRGKPVVFRKALQNIPAMKKWTEQNYLKNRFSDIPVDVIVKKANFKKEPKKMKFGKFLKDYLYDNLYLSNFVPQEMMPDLVLPKCLNCGFDKWLMESELWMSSGGTSSLLHSHADHDVHCIISGRKDFIFIENKYKDVFSYHEKEEYFGAGYSDINMDEVNMFKYENIKNVPWIWTTLRQGDCVFVPAGYLHQVRSFGKSISYTNHFAPTPEIDFYTCSDKMEMKEYPLSEKKFLWTYIDGKLFLAQENLDAANFKEILLKISRNQTSVTKKLFQSFYANVMETAADDYPPVNQMWSLLVATKQNQPDQVELLRSDIHKLSDETLTRLADVFNIPRKQLPTPIIKKEEL